MGVLYLVSTPIGNREDITLRALRVLREVALVAAEDTRHTRTLLQHYDIATPTVSYNEHNHTARLPDLLATLATGDVALVSDAGTPLLADPGAALVQACHTAQIPVVAIPGANAPLTALVASGLATTPFVFLGFPPRRPTERQRFFAPYAALPATLVFFESPHRVAATLHDLYTTVGDREVVLARELTKRYEQYTRLLLSACAEHFAAQPPRGEYTVVVAGAPADSLAPDTAPIDDAEAGAAIRTQLANLRAAGLRSNQAIRQVAAATGLSRRVLYQWWLELDAPAPHDVDDADGHAPTSD